MTPTNVATLYILLGSSEPVSREAVEGALASTLTTEWKAFDHGTLNYLTPSWKRMFDDEGNLLGYNVVGGALDGVPAQAPYAYLTGFLWHLFSRSPPIDFAGARSRILGEPRQTLRDGGAQELQISLVPYGTRPSGYRDWPAMPPLPTTTTTTAPAAPSKAGFPWWVLFPFLAEALKHVR